MKKVIGYIRPGTRTTRWLWSCMLLLCLFVCGKRISAAVNERWGDQIGDYADSNAVLIPTVEAGPTEAMDWQYYE